jgi:hypothetical protein
MPQQHDVHTKYSESRSSGSKDEGVEVRENTDTHEKWIQRLFFPLGKKHGLKCIKKGSVL